MMNANSAAAAARQNAHIQVEAARDSIDRGREENQQFGRRVGQVKGQQAASMAANGIDIGEGTALTVQQDTAALAGEDAQNLYRNINERTKGFDMNAANYTAEAAAKKQEGRSTLVNSFFQAGSSLMGGFQQNAAIRTRLGLTGGG